MFQDWSLLVKLNQRNHRTGNETWKGRSLSEEAKKFWLQNLSFQKIYYVLRFSTVIDVTVPPHQFCLFFRSPLIVSCSIRSFYYFNRQKNLDLFICSKFGIDQNKYTTRYPYFKYGDHISDFVVVVVNFCLRVATLRNKKMENKFTPFVS